MSPGGRVGKGGGRYKGCHNSNYNLVNILVTNMRFDICMFYIANFDQIIEICLIIRQWTNHYTLLLNLTNLKSRAVFELPIINCTYNVNISGTYNNLFARSTALDNYFHFN